MNNKKFLIGALVAAAIVIGGVAYFGTGANQQASIGSLAEKSLFPKKPKTIAGEGTGTGEHVKVVTSTPTFPNDDLPKDVQEKLMTVISALKSTSVETSPVGDKKHYWVQENDGWCVVGHRNTIDYVFQC